MKTAQNIQKIVGLTQLREGGVAYINMLAAMGRKTINFTNIDRQLENYP